MSTFAETLRDKWQSFVELSQKEPATSGAYKNAEEELDTALEDFLVSEFSHPPGSPNRRR